MQDRLSQRESDAAFRLNEYTRGVGDTRPNECDFLEWAGAIPIDTDAAFPARK